MASLGNTTMLSSILVQSPVQTQNSQQGTLTGSFCDSWYQNRQTSNENYKSISFTNTHVKIFIQTLTNLS
jgi:hypothetical protein